MSDHLFDPAIVRRLLARAARPALTLAVDRDLANPLLDIDDATKVAVGRDGAILRIGKTLARFDAIDTGLFRATPALAEAIRAAVADGGAGSLSDGVQRLADRGQAMTRRDRRRALARRRRRDRPGQGRNYAGAVNGRLARSRLQLRHPYPRRQTLGGSAGGAACRVRPHREEIEDQPPRSRPPGTDRSRSGY